jgi:catechol 2,3-dioxygenase-like lactoylglutathione lyase family enzyme
MLKIRHIALASQHPGHAAEFYKNAFGWRELARTGKHDDPAGVVLSDGSINVTILRFQTDQIGKGLAYEGFHHMGVLVDDVDAERARLEAMGVPCIVDAHEIPNNAQFEIKFQGPSDIVFDITDVAWPGSTDLDGNPAPDVQPTAAEQGRSRKAAAE